MLISDEYRAQNSEMHRTKPLYGVDGGRHAEMIRQMAKHFNAETVLDYGAGKQSLAHTLKDMDVRSYDPAVPEISNRPEPADIVVALDVLEHIEPDALPFVLDDIRALAEKAVIFTIHTGPANKHLPDGRNAHLIQWDVNRWVSRLVGYFDIVSVQSGKNGFLFIGTV